MDDEDFLTVIEALRRELRASGAADIAFDGHYIWAAPEGGEARLHDPRRHLVLMLQAFGRKLAIEDRATYRSAMDGIWKHTRGQGPEGAVVVGVDPESPPADLSSAPELGEVRADLRLLIGQLLEPSASNREAGLMDRAAAMTAIQVIFANYRAAQPGDRALSQALTDGKLYELYVLSQLVDEVSNRGFSLSFVGATLKFKTSPGMIKTSDPHFEVKAPGSVSVDYRIFVDIEFDTLGLKRVNASDHLDMVVTTVTEGYPRHNEIAFGLKCKGIANFTSRLVKEALGVRRGLSYFDDQASDSILTQAGGTPAVQVRANPASEYWVAHLDPKGADFVDSVRALGIELKHFEP